MEILNKLICLTLNSAWQPVGQKTVKDAIYENFNLAKQYIDSLSYSFNILKNSELISSFSNGL